MESWKDISGYETYYQVSSYGNVRNTKTNKIITGDVNSSGYRRVILYKPIKKRVFVHRLVAKTFVNGYDKDLVVNHIDGNKTNNNSDNLEWITRSDNDKHAFKLGLRKSYACTFKSKIICYNLLTNEIIKVYDTSQDCAEELMVNRSNIYATCKGKQKSCRGFGLRYED